MSTLADSMLSWKANLTTRATPEQVLKLRADVNAFADGVRFLESENAKLRELVRMMLRVAGVAEYATDIEWQTITHYLRELGMEVDDGNH